MTSRAVPKIEAGDDESNGSMAIVPVNTPACIQAQSSPAPLLGRSSSQAQICPVNQNVSHQRTLMPVNIKQVTDAWISRNNQGLVINNTYAYTLKFLGRVTHKVSDEYKGTFKVDDGTGRMDASIWFTCGRDELDCIPEGSYATVIGRIKLDGAFPEILTYCCRPLSNFNDITHHHLSVIAVHIDLVEKPAKTIHARVAEMWEADRKRADPPPRKTTPSPMPTLQQKPITKASGSAPNPTTNNDKKGKKIMEPNISDSQKMSTREAIVAFLIDNKESAGPSGLHIDKICSVLHSSKDVIRSHLNDLELTGEVYSTVDDDHFYPT